MNKDIEEYRRPMREGLGVIEIDLTEEQLDYFLEEAKKNNSTIDEVVENIVRDYIEKTNVESKT